ncbi:marginal zone B- and B1-cell-specific protein isoform X2 [Eulemur rufifrons]|uniref:marginal zone B- and B1-cell-specific protein isoform X2 n=1 Tax=Eulemur rufifrons TaxID=859984 RepID=UPI003742952D
MRRSTQLTCLPTCAVTPAGLWLTRDSCPAPLSSSPETLAPSPSLFQMGQHLAKAEAKLHTPDSEGRRQLSESVYTDVLDLSCSQQWQDYGVREVNKVKHLVGPGLSKGPEPSISVMVTGGPWPIRLSTTCLHYLGEFGEDRIYAAHQEGREALEALLCGGPQGACSEEVPATREEL